MANRNNNNFNFEIPGIIIFLAFCFCWPVGIVLLVLNSISKENKRRERRNNRSSNANTSQTYYNYNYGNVNNTTAKKEEQDKAEPVKRKSSALFRAFTAGGICSFVIAVICFLAQIGAGFSSFTPIAFALAYLAVAACLLVGADLTKKRDTRLSRIRAIIGKKNSINLTKLASASNADIKKIRRDVQKLIDDGEFGDSAYIDLGTNNFMRFADAEPDDPEMFDYKSLYEEILKNDKKSEKEAPADENQAEKSGDVSDKEHFEKIIRQIRHLNDEIEDKEVSDKIDIIEGHTKNIFDYVTDNPEAMSQIRTFMNYYLPTTLKLLQSYSRIERVGVAGENMKRSKDNIEKTLDLLVIGFEQQVDQLFKNEYIDISSDISVLEQMMQKDGLDKGDNDILSYIGDEPVEEFTDDIGDGFGSGAAAQSLPKK